MADTSPTTPQADAETGRKRFWSKPAGRVAFWVCGGIAVAAAAVALIGAGQDSGHGLVYLFGLAVIAVLILFAIAAGEAAGQTMRRQVARNTAPSTSELGYAAMDGFPDPVLISDQRGAARWANAAYRELARQAGGFGQSFGLPTVDRLWAGSGGGDGTVYRLARSAAQGEAARELLPPLDLGEHGVRRFHLEAAPQSNGLVLWRLAPAGDRDGDGAGVLSDWSQHSPVALFSLRPNGDVPMANATLRDWLGLGEGVALPPL
ncbi:MAG: two-component system cell cycle sensor histidine kinase/response regulator CckA, partial [Maricaulis maris]